MTSNASDSLVQGVKSEVSYIGMYDPAGQDLQVCLLDVPHESVQHPFVYMRTKDTGQREL